MLQFCPHQHDKLQCARVMTWYVSEKLKPIEGDIVDNKLGRKDLQ